MSYFGQIAIKVITPIHVGCGEVFEPISFVVDETESCISVFEPHDLFAALSREERRQFEEICQRGTVDSILDFYRFFRGKKIDGRKVNVSEGFVDRYRRTLSLGYETFRRELNSFSILRTAYSPQTGRPYLPGSAVKGALRTAYLAHLVSPRIQQLRGRPELRGRPNGQRLEEYLLGGRFATDPFRLVKVSDFHPVGAASTTVQYAVNVKKSRQEPARGIQQTVEVVEPEALFTGTLEIQDPPDSSIRQPVEPETLFESARQFFGDEWTREQRELTGVNSGASATGTLLRVGFHCGAESITLPSIRSIRVRTGPRQSSSRDRPTTVWLVSETRDPDFTRPVTFGWISMERLSAEQQSKLSQRERDFLRAEQERLARLQKRRAAEAKQVEQERLEAEAERARQEQEVRQKAEEEKRRREEWEKLSPAERDAATVRRGDVLEIDVVAVYGRLDEYSAEEQRLIAGCLKNFYQRIGKWDERSASKKQKIKIQRIKDLLGEE